jgi:uncharacterized membrane protein
VEKDSARLEAFSDGVFAFAITLLALDLRVPVLDVFAGPADLRRALWDLWPSALTFVASFISILIMWINHHGIFKHLRRMTPELFFSNGLLLMMVTVTPFTTSLVARYLRTPAGSLAAAVYCASFVVISLAYNWLWHSASECGEHTAHHKRVTENYKIGFPIYAGAVVAAFITPYLALAICVGLWGFWAATMREA